MLKIPLQSDESRTIICRNNCLIDRRLNKFKETLPAHGKPKPFRKQKKGSKLQAHRIRVGGEYLRCENKSTNELSNNGAGWRRQTRSSTRRFGEGDESTDTKTKTGDKSIQRIGERRYIIGTTPRLQPKAAHPTRLWKMNRKPKEGERREWDGYFQRERERNE